VAVDQLLRRFARDQWVRLHGTPRVTVLAGDDQLLAVYRSWLAITAAKVFLFDSPDVDRSIRDACAHASTAAAETVAVHASRHAIDAWRAGRSDRLAAMVTEGLVVANEPTSSTSFAHLDARSAAELAFFEALEATPATAGRFKLNESLSVRFGSNACEVDLLSRGDRIAIEIDGFHHFTDPVNYRRDRRKDLLMQQQGLMVVRVLAEDVMADPRPGIHMVCQALASRLGKP
jgi:hypothetical protein